MNNDVLLIIVIGMVLGFPELVKGINTLIEWLCEDYEDDFL